MNRVLAALAAASLLVFAIAHVQAQPSRGKQVYDSHCVECHGDTGRGDGPGAAFLHPRPRDFTSGKFKLRSTIGGAPTLDDVIQTVRRGMYGTSMPGWDRILPDADIAAVAAYVRSLAAGADATPSGAPIAETPAPSSPESIERGRHVYEKLQCAKCHGTDGRGAGAVRTVFDDDWGRPLNAADLTEPWTFRGGAAARDIYLRFRAGMAGTPMPSFDDAANRDEMSDLANYVVSLGRKPLWSMSASEVADFYARQDAEAKKDPVKRGEYLVETIGCVLCHSPYDDKKRMLPGMRLAGGMRLRIEPFGDYPTGNLTSDKATGLGSWSDDEIKRAMTKGVLRDGTRLLPFPMDWPSYSTMKPEDIDAIVAYLRTVPPVYNRVPQPVRTALPLFLWGKFKLLILGGDPPMTFFAGNVGTTQGGRR